MTTEINATQSVQAKKANAGFNDVEELSDETKNQLEALGITVTAGMTEAEAQELIEESKEESFEKTSVQQKPGAVEISTDIKNLASVIGLSYEDDDTPDEILTRIAEEIEAQIDDAENNPQALSTLMGYYHQLSSLDAQLDAVQSGENKLYAAMDLLANSNRKQFGF